jgi:NADH-quinone oxidoreductase subunit G
LHGGDPGRRLIEPDAANDVAYFEQIPAAFERREGEWLATPLYHIFGSEPLSMFTPGVAELAPKPYLGLNPGDAERLQRAKGGEVRIMIGEWEQTLPI